MQILLLILAIAAPIAWFISEFQPKKWPRILLGMLSFVGIFCMGSLLAVVLELDANSYFGSNNDQLISAIIEGLERKNPEEVLAALKTLNEQYHPTYESRAKFEELVDDFAQKMSTAEQARD